MPVLFPTKPSFASGRLSPRLFSRIDLDQYVSGLDTCRNFIVYPHGGATFRPGTQFVAPTKANGVARLLPFIFSRSEGYVLEAGATYLRVFSEHAPTLGAPLTITGASATNPVVITSTTHGLVAGRKVFIDNVGGMTELNGRYFTVGTVATDTFELVGEDGSGYTAYTTGGTAEPQVELVTPYTTGDVDALRYTQSGDVMFLAVRARAPREVRRLSATAWETVEFDFLDGPYDDVNTTTTTLTPAATTGSGIAVTASATTGINGGQGFLTTDVGRLIRIEYSGAWGWAEIVGWTSTTVVTVDIRRAFGATTGATAWRLGAWSGTTGWPEVVHFHQQRLWFGRGQFLWGSRTGDFNNFAPDDDGDGTVVDSSAVTYRIGEGLIDKIEWLQSSRVLEVGTGSMEFAFLGGAGPDSALTPDSVKARKETERGSFNVGQPVYCANGTVFLNRAGRKLLNYYYSFQADSYVAVDITELSEDLPYPFCFEMAYQAEPDLLIWVVRADGALIAVTFNPAQDVTAWHEHTIGGTYDGGAAVVESICNIPSPDGTTDELWLSVLRTVGGQTVRYLEFLTPTFGPLTDIKDAFFVDSGGTYEGTPTLTITGLDHLEGEEVAVLADGALRPRQTVEDGQITIPGPPASVVTVGLPYTGQLILLPMEPGDLGNAMTANRSRVVEIGLLFYRTVLAKVGIVGKPLERVGRRTASDNLSEPLEPRTEYEKVPVESDSEYRNRIQIVQDEPLPCTVLSVQPKFDR